MHSNYPFTSVFSSNPPTLPGTWQSVNLIPVQFISTSTGEPIEASTQGQDTPSPASQPVWVRRKKITLDPGNLGPVHRVILRSGYKGPCNRIRGGADSGDDDDGDGSDLRRMQLIPRGLDPASFRRQLQLRAISSPQKPVSGPGSDDLKRKRDEDEDADELASDKRPKHDLQGQAVRDPFTPYDAIERETTSKVPLVSPSASPSASPAARPAASLSSPPHLGLDNSAEGSDPRRRSSRIKGQPKQTKK